MMLGGRFRYLVMRSLFFLIFLFGVTALWMHPVTAGGLSIMFGFIWFFVIGRIVMFIAWALGWRDTTTRQ